MKNDMTDPVEELVRALETVRDGNIPRPVAKHWRADEEPSKNDKCPHGAWMYDDCANCVSNFISLALSRFNAERGDGSFQSRVAPWMQECFGSVISADEVERGDRLIEEVFEALQSRGYDPARIAALRDYVWSRPVGETSQEVGGIMVTLAAFCLATGTDMHEAGEVELSRIWTKVPQIRAKQAAKPTGSALPIPAAINPEGKT